MVRTDGPDGKLADFEIKYTFGVSPLQQYLIEFPGGRYQTLGIAWDARPKGEGGQRWFHLYPNEKIDHKDQLHWTGLYQNWNLQCAACHSTNLQERLRRGEQHLQDHLQRDQRRVRGLPRAGLASRRMGEAGATALHAAERQRPRRSEKPLERGVEVSGSGREVRAARPARRRCAHERLRGLSCPPLDHRGSGPRRRAARGHASPGAAHAAELPRRRSAARGGLHLGLVPPEQDVPARRDLHGLPRAARAEASRRG